MSHTNHLILANCRTDVASFDKATSCVSNSSFLNDCKTCQQCIMKYQTEQGSKFQGEIFQVILVNVLNLCSNSTSADVAAALRDQAAKLSNLGTRRTTSGTDSPTSVPTPAASITTSPASIPTSPTSLITPAAVTPNALAQNSYNESSNIKWIVGPTIGSVLGLVALLAVVFFFRRKQSRGVETDPVEIKKVDNESEFGESRVASPHPQPHIEEDVEPKELETVEIYELPASEPVGAELHTPRDGKMDEGDWPLPMGALRAMFVETEMRDERMGDESPQHQTFYNP